MVDGFSTAPLRRDDIMSYGGDDQGGVFPYGWDNPNLMSFDNNDSLQDGDFQQLFNPFVCECHNYGFQKKTDLNRHLAKETRKFLCDITACPSTQPNGEAPVFGTFNDKKRHYRDVHGIDIHGNPLPKFPCPWTNCKRHADGFPRLKNLENHLKSLHDSQRPETSNSGAAAASSSAAIPQAGPSSTAPSTAATSFAAPAPPLSSAPLAIPAQAVPATPLTPSLTRDPTLDPAVNTTPPDSQWAGPSAPLAPLQPLTDAEADDEVVNAYMDDIASLRADYSSQSTHLARIKRDLVSMQATANSLEQNIHEKYQNEAFLLTKLAQRKDAIRAGRTQNAQRRRANANATAPVTGATTTAPPTMQSE